MEVATTTLVIRLGRGQMANVIVSSGGSLLIWVLCKNFHLPEFRRDRQYLASAPRQAAPPAYSWPNIRGPATKVFQTPERDIVIRVRN